MNTYDEEDKKPEFQPEEFPIRKLNFNLPLLSTKRPSEKEKKPNPPQNSNPNNTSRDRVPFSWERTPGEPKDKTETTDILGNIIDIPLPPKPPPGRWQPPPAVITVKEKMNSDEFCGYDDACDDDVDDDDDDCHDHHHNGCFSDAIDIFSLAESVEDDADIEENVIRATKGKIRSTNSEHYNIVNDFQHSPNFIIRRFLPDAQALAAASVMNRKLPDDSSFTRAISIRRSYNPSPKGCGLGSFFPFPWKIKPKPCGLKSPVRDPIKRRIAD